MRSIFKARDSATKRKQGPLSGRILLVGQVEIKVGPVIGEGGFATVYASCTKEREGKQQELQSYALKHFVLNGDQEMMRHVQKEISVLQSLSSCPHVVQMIDYSLGGKEAFILLELCGSSLADYINDVYSKNGKMLASYSSIDEIEFKLSNDDILNLFQQVALGIKSLHSDELVHRDIKAENILSAEDSRLVLCDFGSVSHCSKAYESRVEVAREEDTIRKETTPAYRAPELWDFNSWSTQQRIGRPGDIFSLGCLLYLMSYGSLPFDAKNSLQILNVDYTLRKGRKVVIETLIRSMLTSDPKTRPSIDTILNKIMESNKRIVDPAGHIPWEAKFEDLEVSDGIKNIDSGHQTSRVDRQCTDYEILKSHCQVVEQLLEERVMEIKVLQEELREHKIQLKSLQAKNANKDAMIADLQDRYKSLKYEKEKQECFGSFPINLQVQNSVDDQHDGNHHDLNQQNFADLDPVSRINAER
eukprot:jgi/Picsp_1/5100/NSC_02463-R1_serine threonine protein kinase